MEQGVVKVVNGLRNEFAFSVCCLDAKGALAECLPAEVAVYELRRQPGKNARIARAVRRLIKREGADIVHTHSFGCHFYAVSASVGTSAAVIAGEHGDLYTLHPQKKYAILRRLLACRTALFQTVSETMRNDLIRCAGIPARKVRAIPNGVDTARFAPADPCACRRKLNLPEDAVLLGLVGRLNPVKRFDMMVRILPLLRRRCEKVAVVLVGDGEERERLRELSEGTGCAERVFFLGYRTDMESIYPALDLLVHPSRSEGMSNVMLEAMSCGVPVVASDIPAHGELISDGDNGFLFSANSGEALLGRLAQILSEPELRVRVGAQARKSVEARFRLETMVEGYRRLYRQIAEGLNARERSSVRCQSERGGRF